LHNAQRLVFQILEDQDFRFQFGNSLGRGCLIGAGALVTEGKEIPDGSLVMGAPGKVVRTLDAEAQAALLGSAERYRANAARFRAGLKEI